MEFGDRLGFSFAARWPEVRSDVHQLPEVPSEHYVPCLGFRV